MMSETWLTSSLAPVLGSRTANALEKAFGYRTVMDLLLHVPRRYSERGELTDLRQLRRDEHVTVMARVVRQTTRPMRNRKGSITEIVVTDGRDELSLTFFRAPRIKNLRPGRVGLFAGKVSAFGGKLQLTHPECFLPDEDADIDSESFAGQIVPVYAATSRASSWSIAKSVATALDQLDWNSHPDPLPTRMRDELDLPSLGEAFEWVHRPTSTADIERGLNRLRFDEALSLQVILAQRRDGLARSPAVARRGLPGGLLANFDSSLPFELTPGQQEAGREIQQDLARSTPMHRLLQGEVGSGKTVVALRAMLTVVDSGGQAALLAPTEVLAVQHARSIEKLLGQGALGGLFGASGGTRVALITGSMSTAARRQALLDVASGEAGIVVGTHALLSQSVVFSDLALVVVDEQHRFGVEQRAELIAKAQTGSRPHILVMTATPIPRTVAITVFGDLDVSVIKELPRGRSPIETFVVPTTKPSYIERMYERIREEVGAGRQAYIVCPRIDDVSAQADDMVGPDPDDDDDPRVLVSVDGLFEELVTGPLAGLRCAKLHGRMSADDISSTMSAFGAGKVDVLVATTVIEVGVDVPNATVMVIMDADRFGISQLHQLRGRIGRGEAAGICLLVTSATPDSPGWQRLETVAATADGFELARRDLQARREGDVLGVDQAGRRNSLRLLVLLRDEQLILAARECATRLIEQDPDLSQHPELADWVAEIVGPQAAHWLERS